jgi:hypothetical protein
MDLFVHAKSPQHALIDWKLYYDGWDMPEAAIVYDPTGPALAGSVLTWDAIPRTAFTL